MGWRMGREREREIMKTSREGVGKGQSSAGRPAANCVPCCHWSAPLLNQRPALPVKVTRCSMGIHRSGHVIAQPGADWRREAGGEGGLMKPNGRETTGRRAGGNSEGGRREGECDYFFSRMWSEMQPEHRRTLMRRKGRRRERRGGRNSKGRGGGEGC